MLYCAQCDFSDEHSIVPHIREKHDLSAYVNLLFPDLQVVSKDLFAAIENAVFFGYVDDTAGLADIIREEREMILVAAKNNMPMRSEIVITQDF